MTNPNTLRMSSSALAQAAAGVAFQRKDDPIDLLTRSFEAHIANVGQMLTDQKAKQDEIREWLHELEQKGARQIHGTRIGENETWGSVVSTSNEVKALANDRGKATISVKAITSDAGSAGALISNDRDPGIVMRPKRRMTVRQLLGPGKTESNTIEFMQQTGFTNNARPVAEGTLKPESSLSFEMKETKVRTIAHWMQASRQVLSDSSLLLTTIDGELRYGLEYEEENQLLAGDGTGQNLYGIIPQATAYEVARNKVGDTRFDTLLHAIEQAEVAELPASGIMLNTSDWYAMMGIKDGDGNYLSGGPLANVPERVWRLPIVYTNAMPSGHFLVGAFATAVTVYDREEAIVMMSTEDRDNFVKNLVTILGEERLAVAVKRPEAIIYGAFPVAK